MKREQLPQYMAGVKQERPTLGQIVETQCEIRRGGHLVWPHASRYVQPAGRNKVLIQRALWEASNGPIPSSAYLLNKCGVKNCVAPDCHALSRYSTWRDEAARHSRSCASDDRVCNGVSSELHTCVRRHDWR